MLKSVRVRLMVGALVFALAWALGIESNGTVPSSVTFFCLAVGSFAFAYLVGLYHRAWRTPLMGPDERYLPGVRNWSGVSMVGLTIRAEYITGAFALMICAIGMFEFFRATSQPTFPTTSNSPPVVMGPEVRPLQ
jgi:hypothetical protein